MVFVKQGDDMPTWVSTEGGNRYNIRHRKNLRFLGTHYDAKQLEHDITRH